MTKPIKISLTADFYAAITEYADMYNMKVATVIAELAAVGYKLKTGKSISAPTNTQGGWRGNENSRHILLLENAKKRLDAMNEAQLRGEKNTVFEMFKMAEQGSDPARSLVLMETLDMIYELMEQRGYVDFVPDDEYDECDGDYEDCS